jgi:hypothetical protein
MVACPGRAMTQASVARLLRLSFDRGAKIGHVHSERVCDLTDGRPGRRGLAQLDTRQGARRDP